MPLLRGMARTAVVAGTATAVSNRVSRRQANRWGRQEEEQYAQQGYQEAPQQSYEQPAPAAAAPAGDDRYEKLKELGDLKAQGILTEEEFAAEKARILGQ